MRRLAEVEERFGRRLGSQFHLAELATILIYLPVIFFIGCQTRPEFPQVENYDFIAAFNEAEVDLGQQAIAINKSSQLLESGFRKSPESAHAQASTPQVRLRFDSPWERSATRLGMALRASRSGRVRIMLNGEDLGETSVRETERNYFLKVPAGLLQPQANLLTLQTLDAVGVSLSALVLPPTYSMIQFQNRRTQLLPGPPPTRLTYRLRAAGSSRLTFETAYDFPAAAVPEGKLVFEVTASSGFFSRSLFKREVILGPDSPAQAAESAVVELGALAGEGVDLTFGTTFKGKTCLPLAGNVGWVRPQLRSVAPPGEASKPSLIVWLVDTQREDHMGCYGYQRATTPHTDAFAREAVQFQNMLSNSSWTKASIATLFTGLHPSAHGAVGRTDRLLPQVTTLAQVLREAGYRTTAFSANAVFHSKGWDICRGFEEVYTFRVHRSREGRGTLKILSDLVPWLEEVGDEPFFLFIHTVDPHSPYRPPPEYCRMFNKVYRGRFTKKVGDPGQWVGVATEAEKRQFEALYDSEIAFGDHCFGRFISMLKKLKLYDSWYTLFLSDHGEELNDHRNWGHGQSLHEELLRLPMLLRLPEERQAGTVVGGTVSGINLMPSLLEWLKIEGPAGPGASFAAAVEAGRDPEAVEILAEQALDKHRLYSLTSGNYKYILRLDPQQEEAFYDLGTDPAEQQNLFGSHAAQAAPLAARVATYREAAERGTRVVFVNPTKTSVKGEIVAQTPITTVRGIKLSSSQGVPYGLSEDRRRLWFRFSVEKWPRGFIFDLERPELGATLHLDSLDEHAEWPIYLGGGNQPAPAVPVDLVGPELLAGSGKSIVPSDPKIGCFVWRIPGGGDMGPTKLSDKETENLRALGYIE